MSDNTKTKVQDPNTPTYWELKAKVEEQAAEIDKLRSEVLHMNEQVISSHLREEDYHHQIAAIKEREAKVIEFLKNLKAYDMEGFPDFMYNCGVSLLSQMEADNG